MKLGMKLKCRKYGWYKEMVLELCIKSVKTVLNGIKIGAILVLGKWKKVEC